MTLNFVFHVLSVLHISAVVNCTVFSPAITSFPSDILMLTPSAVWCKRVKWVVDC